MEFKVKIFAVQAKKKGIVLDKGMEPGLLGSCTIAIDDRSPRWCAIDDLERTAKKFMDTVVELEITNDEGVVI